MQQKLALKNSTKARATSETEKEREPESRSLFSKIGRFFGGGGSKEKLDKQSQNNRTPEMPVK